MRLTPVTSALVLALAAAACSDNGAAEADAPAAPETEMAAAAPETADNAAMAAGAELTETAAPQSPAEPELTPEEQAQYDAAVAAAADADPTLAVLGDPDAPVQIVEYASTTCPHCATFHADLFPHVKETWIDSGQASLAMRALPTPPAQLSVAGFLLARCAGDGEAFFAALGDLFETQAQLAEAAQAGELQAYYEEVAGRHGMAPEELNTCLAGQEGVNQINASIQAAQADGVSSTPSFVINGTLAQGLADEAAWDAAIEAALAEQD